MDHFSLGTSRGFHINIAGIYGNKWCYPSYYGDLWLISYTLYIHYIYTLYIYIIYIQYIIINNIHANLIYGYTSYIHLMSIDYPTKQGIGSFDRKPLSFRSWLYYTGILMWFTPAHITTYVRCVNESFTTPASIHLPWTYMEVSWRWGYPKLMVYKGKSH